MIRRKQGYAAIKRFWLVTFVVVAFVGLQGCAAALVGGAINAASAINEQAKQDAKAKPKMTQLEMRQLQTRTYDTTDRKQVLQVALAVLQDDGFVIENANADLGLLTAAKSLIDVQVDDPGTAFLKGLTGFGGDVSQKEHSTIRASVSVSPRGNKIRVRFAPRLSSIAVGNLSVDQSEEVITDGKFYQDFFAKLEKGLFIEREKL